MASIQGSLQEKGLVKGTNWWGAFVIGLAGTILVTGIAPYVVHGTGALGIILIGVMTIAGCFLCLKFSRRTSSFSGRGFKSLSRRGFKFSREGLQVSLEGGALSSRGHRTGNPRKF